MNPIPTSILRVIVSLVISFGTCLPAAEPVRKPNIVFIFSDDHSIQTIGAYESRLSEFCRKHAITPNIDYAPTFMEITGGRTPDGLHGRSFVPVLKSATPADWRKSVYYHYYDKGHGVPVHYGLRAQQFTLAHFPATKEWELFDLKKDPQQVRNVFADRAYAANLTELQAELARLRAQYNATEETGPAKQGKKAKK